MNIGVDAAAFGMANAVTASTANVNSGYWNPAGLVQLEDNQLALMHASYFANIANYDYAGFAMPLDKQSAVALSVIRFGVDDILNTTQLIDEQGIDTDTSAFILRTGNDAQLRARLDFLLNCSVKSANIKREYARNKCGYNSE